MKFELKNKVVNLVMLPGLFLFVTHVNAEVRLPRLIGDGMVLQRQADVKVWGWADVGEAVSVKFNGKSFGTVACDQGRWEITIGQLEAGGPYDMQIVGENTISIGDIMVGDVWVCSGQSNMELPMERVKYKYADEIEKCANSAIRQFYVPRKYNFKEPQVDIESGEWVKADPQTLLGFTAVGYFFAKDLYEEYQVPIGLINTSLGGSPVEAWMSEEALKKFPNHLETAMKYRDDTYIDQIVQKDNAASGRWYGDLARQDKGLTEKWYECDVDDSDWKEINVPGYWADELGLVNGAIWLRKDIHVSGSMAGKDARLWLGRIVDADDTYINGKRVGGITYEWPPRIYDVPAGLLKEGENSIVVRVIHNGRSRAGLVPEKSYELTVGDERIDLSGMWKYKIGTECAPLKGRTFVRWQPMGLYNAMISPLLNYSMKGVIWYQGESNTANPKEYDKTFPAMIADWRENWEQGDFPFLYVQLANFMAETDVPVESNWARLRQSQLKTLSVKNTAMVVTIDIGETTDIHPLNKKDVGKRLGLAAKSIAYGRQDIIYSGPIYKSMQIDEDKIILSFTHTGSGLVAKDGELRCFAIAGEDKKYEWATAVIGNDEVIVHSDKVKEPIAVRYGWADNPLGANLYNKEGLPASPFTTEN